MNFAHIRVQTYAVTFFLGDHVFKGPVLPFGGIAFYFPLIEQGINKTWHDSSPSQGKRHNRVCDITMTSQWRILFSNLLAEGKRFYI